MGARGLQLHLLLHYPPCVSSYEDMRLALAWRPQFNLIAPAMTLLPCKVTFSGLGRRTSA